MSRRGRTLFEHRGSVARTGLIVQIDSTSFARPVDGPAALVRWLSGKKCADLKYELAGEF